MNWGRLLCALGWPLLVLASIAFVWNYHGWLVSGNRYSAAGAVFGAIAIVSASVAIATSKRGPR